MFGRALGMFRTNQIQIFYTTLNYFKQNTNASPYTAVDNNISITSVMIQWDVT